jgi:hypothetical protein
MGRAAFGRLRHARRRGGVMKRATYLIGLIAAYDSGTTSVTLEADGSKRRVIPC